MNQSRPKLHFAMLTYGALEDTKRAVRSLAANTQAAFMLHVVDNASSDGTQAWLDAQQEPWLRYHLNRENRGVPGGRNDLLDFILPQVADDDWIIFIDNDLEFEAGWLEPFVHAMQSYVGAGVMGKVGHFITVEHQGRELMPAPCRTAHVDVVSGGFACFVRADAARTIGKFDEQLGRFWHEDDDYCVRALQHGIDVIAVPEAAIVHHEHASGVALPDLADGGSRTNLSYLVEKWRAAGYVDSQGWIKREHGPYIAPTVHTELRRRLGRPAGRSELAAAMQLLENLIDGRDAKAWFHDNRQPIPACTWPLLHMHRQQAEQAHDRELVTKLAGIEVMLRRTSNTVLVRGLMRTLSTHHGPLPGHGVCRETDFACASFRNAAEQLNLTTLVQDPHAHTTALWEMLALTAHLLHAGVNRPGARVLNVGDEVDRLPQWLAQHGAQLEHHETASRARGTYDAIVFKRVLDTDLITTTIASHAGPDTRIFVCGPTVLNGVPSSDTPQPHQLALDLLARTQLQPIAPVTDVVDDGVLEACATEPTSSQTPQLSWIQGPQICTWFVLACQHVAGKQDHTRGKVIVPARPLVAQTLRVGVDLRTLFQADSTARGIGKFTTQHLAALCDAEPGLRLIGYTPNDDSVLPPVLQRPEITARCIDDYRPDDVDLVHIPDPMNMSIGFDSPTRVLRHAQTSVTFHDLTPLHHYIDHWPRANREGYLDRLRQLERGSCHLLTNSQFTAHDLLANTSITPERVTAILAGLHHNGSAPPSADQIAEVHQELGIHGPFVLHVGALDPHKNFHAALNAFLMTRARQPLQMVVVGAIDPGTAQAAAFCSQRKVPDVVFTGYLPRKHLDALYASTVALLFLSRAEGFGLPILEAMAKGCPVIASDATSHPEVAGDAALLVDPDDQNGAARHIQQLLTDPLLASQLKAQGLQQASSFSWQAVAARTIEAWRKMATTASSRATGPLTTVATTRA